MKKILTVSLLALAFVFPSISQTTLTIYPDKDAMIRYTNYPANSNDDDTNFGTYGYIMTYQWTWSGYPVTMKSLIGIDLSSLPDNATITDAKLYLYESGGHQTNLTTGSGSYKSNASYLRRITTSWSESTVTWNTAPTTITNNQVTLANSSTTDQDYIVDVTNLIKDIQANPSSSDGLMFSLVTESAYTEMQFASSDHATSSLHPKLEITYTATASNMSYPDYESFEFADTKWENVTGDDMDWLRDSDGTPSTSTGPSCASNGKYYAYIEASGNLNKTALMQSPSYNLQDSESAYISFDYHMLGSTMGNLYLEISTDDGTNWNTTALWSKSGNLGDTWYNKIVDLSSYTGGSNPIRLRFRGVTLGGLSSDMAIDNIKVTSFKTTTLTETENYVHSTTATTDQGLSGPVQQNIQYIDGLGRPLLEIGIGSSPEGNDMVKPIEYDDFGRAFRNYLPFAAGDEENGTFRDYETTGDDVLGMQEEFFQDLFSLGTNDPYAYSRTVFEESPLNRVLEQGSPGEDFSPIEETDNASEYVREFEYGANTSTDYVRCFDVNASTGALQNSTSYYAANSLLKNTYFDEDGNETEEFNDKQGKVILQRSIEGSNTLSTYYVYDDFGMLRYVIPPKALGDNGIPTSLTITQLCYYYEYDDKHRLIEKQLPGVKSVYMVYDSRDRLVLVQDGELRNDDEWIITVYDELNRPAVTGIWDGSSFTFPSGISAIEDYENFEVTWNSSTHDYDLSSAISSNTTIQSKTYYDDYDYHQSSIYSGLGIDTINNVDTYEDKDGNVNGYFDRVNGQITGSATLVLDGTGSNWIYAVNYYDYKYRVIQTKSTFYPQGTTMISMEYDFIGNILQTLEIQDVNSVENQVRYTYTYDHSNRLLDTYVYYNNNDAVTLAQNSYDELGQLVKKKLHSEDNSDYTQTVDYAYNIRGWLTSINDPSSLGEDKFGMELHYQDVTGSPATTARYNGNISGTSRVHIGGSTEGYEYTYDELNRLKAGDYKTYSGSSWSGSNNFTTSYTYDLNGNIDTLTRKNSSGTTIDSLTYNYTNTGNQLNYIYDASQNSAGVYDQNISGADYDYDDNGNLTLDRNKDMDIDYNYLNLPEKIQEEGGSGDELLYIYDASGTKLLKKLTDGSDTIKTMYAGSFIYEDIDNNGTYDFELDYILNPEGKFDNQSTEIKYHYHLKDHLGNTRVVFNGGDTVIQMTDYYPFGLTFTDNQGSNNKYLYNGKELQDEQLGGVNLDWYDYGARMYDPTLGRWHVQDPLSESYYPQSPYHYALNNPIRYTDVLGMGASDRTEVMGSNGGTDEQRMREIEELLEGSPDGYTIDEKGYINREDHTGGKNYDVLYRKKDYAAAKASGKTNEYGNPEPENQITMTNTDILPALKGKGTVIAQGLTTGSINDVFNVFKFAADNSNIEWALARYSYDKYAIWTDHDPGNNTRQSVSNPMQVGLSNVNASLHSHPGQLPQHELSSMGETQTGVMPHSDWHHKIHGKRPYYMGVYFPNTKNIFNITENDISKIRNIGNDYKRFYYGTLNHR